MTKLSLIFPSRRPEQLATCLGQLLRTVPTYDVQVVVIADAPGIREAATPYADLIIDSEPIKAIDAWNLGASKATGDWFFLAADDLYFTEGWLDAFWPYLTPQYGVVGAEDGMNSYVRTGWASHYAASRDFCVNHLGGVLAPSCYCYYWVDVEVCEVAKRKGLFVYAQDAIVEHLHYEWGKSPEDDVYRNVKAKSVGDRPLYVERAAAEFPIAWEPMIHG